MPIKWSDEAEKTLRRMFAEGASDAEIGLAVGVTAHAVIGKRNRLDLFRIQPGMHTDAYTNAIRRAGREQKIGG
jgi:hypothetical protein